MGDQLYEVAVREPLGQEFAFSRSETSQRRRHIAKINLRTDCTHDRLIHISSFFGSRSEVPSSALVGASQQNTVIMDVEEHFLRREGRVVKGLAGPSAETTVACVDDPLLLCLPSRFLAQSQN